jgi:hypothetical protein
MMHKLLLFLAWLGLIYATMDPADARTRHRGCARGQILIRHSGQCVAKASSAAREAGYHAGPTRAERREARRQAREERRAARKAAREARAKGRNPSLTYVQVVDVSRQQASLEAPEARGGPSVLPPPPSLRRLDCRLAPVQDATNWMPDPTGWPGLWVRAQGFPRPAPDPWLRLKTQEITP